MTKKKGFKRVDEDKFTLDYPQIKLFCVQHYRVRYLYLDNLPD